MSEVFFLSTTGIYDGRPYNKVSWYISVLFWVLMLYLYILKSVKRETANLIFSITAFLGIIAVNKRGFRTEFLGDKGDIGYLFEMTMVYGLAMVAIGYFTWQIYDQIRHKINVTLLGKIVWTIMEIALLGYSVTMMHVDKLYTPNHVVCSAVFSALIILFALKIGYVSRLLEKNFWTKLSKYCLAIYLTQAVVVWGIFPKYLTEYQSVIMNNKGMTIAAVLAVCCCLGVWAHYVIEKPCAKFLKRVLS